MRNFFRFRWLIIAVFMVVIVFSVIAMPNVGINYDVLSYLPKDSPSTIAIKQMEESFGTVVGEETRIMVEVSSIPQAMECKEQILSVGLVTDVKWLDDEADVRQPEAFITQSVLESWYKNGHALYQVNFDKNASNAELLSAIDEIRSYIGDEAAISGGEAGNAVQKQETSGQVAVIMLMLVPVVLVIMIISTRSWLEPFLFLAVIGISILINMGTNIFMGEISYVSQMTAAALQLAVSMDYSIFLIHSFTLQRDSGKEPMDAMIAAMKQSFPSIIASGLTTLCGFLALTLMRFGIGVDIGIVLAKGVLISLITVIFLLPVITMLIYRPLENFTHRPFLPSFNGFTRAVMKIGVPVVIFVAILIVPSFLAQNNNHFIYMSSDNGSGSAAISAEFGKDEQMVLLVPEGNVFSEKAMAGKLLAHPNITGIASYVTTVGMEIPIESLPNDTRELLVSGGYSRMVLTVDTASGTDESFVLVESVKQTAEKYYGDSYHLGGTSVSIYDMRETVTADNKVTSLVAIIAISIIVLLTFKSPMMCLLLVGAIEISVWINLSVPYFMGSTIMFMGYMIISSVQLGATVDYAILYGSRYLEKRKSMQRMDAARESLSETSVSILTSAAILFGAGMIISLVSSEGMTSELGSLLGRGAAMSAAMVLLVLPNVIRMCDKLIKKTTYKNSFLEGQK